MSAKTTLENRSMPSATVIPVLAYDDVRHATEWLCAAFGFQERLRIGEHRAQLSIGYGAVIVNQRRVQPDGSVSDVSGHETMVRVDDVESHYARAQAHGACILHPPTDFPYGERQYSVEDPGGHIWTFSQTLADVAPEDWGGSLIGNNGAAS